MRHLLALFAAMLLAGCGLTDETPTYRYRLTVEVDTPDGVRSGSSVIDLDDPTSVALVDPDDLAASFGEGVSLRRMTVEMTDDPVTEGIEERLGWLEPFGRENGVLLPSGSRYLEDAEPINLVSPSDFSTELYH